MATTTPVATIAEPADPDAGEYCRCECGTVLHLGLRTYGRGVALLWEDCPRQDPNGIPHRREVAL